MESKGKRKSIVDMELSTFDIPPSGDVLVLGKRAPVGPQAAKRMLDSVSPGQFELVQLDDDIIEVILCKKYLFSRAEREQFIKAIIEESKAIMTPQCMMRIKCEVSIIVKRAL